MPSPSARRPRHRSSRTRNRVADQRDNAAAHAAAGLIAGGEELADVAPVALGVAIAALVGDASRRHQLAHALGASVDGAGAARILAAL